jgi:hypothetical protein
MYLMNYEEDLLLPIILSNSELKLLLIDKLLLPFVYSFFLVAEIFTEFQCLPEIIFCQVLTDIIY